MAQLMMYRPDAPVPEYDLPADYRVRNLKHGEEHLFCRACIGSFTEDENTENYYRMMKTGVNIENVYVIEYTGSENLPDIAGTATAQYINTNPYLHYVAVRPEHRGKRLIYPVCAAVLRRHAELLGRGCFLTTDDQRVPAIASYLHMGYLPVLWTEDAAERWDKVCALLDKTDVRYLTYAECEADCHARK